jgi:hypothetical protein
MMAILLGEFQSLYPAWGPASVIAITVEDVEHHNRSGKLAEVPHLRCGWKRR